MRSYCFICKEMVKTKRNPRRTSGLVAIVADLKSATRIQEVKELIRVASSETIGNRQVQPTIEKGSACTEGSVDFKLKPPRGEIEICRCRRQETAPATLP